MVYWAGDEQKGVVNVVGEEVAILSCVGWEESLSAGVREREGASEDLEAELEREGKEGRACHCWLSSGQEVDSR